MTKCRYTSHDYISTHLTLWAANVAKSGAVASQTHSAKVYHTINLGLLNNAQHASDVFTITDNDLTVGVIFRTGRARKAKHFIAARQTRKLRRVTNKTAGPKDEMSPIVFDLRRGDMPA